MAEIPRRTEAIGLLVGRSDRWQPKPATKYGTNKLRWLLFVRPRGWDSFIRSVRPGRKLLDVGCGNRLLLKAPIAFFVSYATIILRRPLNGRNGPNRFHR